MKNSKEPKVLFSRTASRHYKPEYIYFPETGEVVPYMDAQVSLVGEQTKEGTVNEAETEKKKSKLLPVLMPDDNGNYVHFFDYDPFKGLLYATSGIKVVISEKGITLRKMGGEKK